jgi:hypothetical protein
MSQMSKVRLLLAAIVAAAAMAMVPSAMASHCNDCPPHTHDGPPVNPADPPPAPPVVPPLVDPPADDGDAAGDEDEAEVEDADAVVPVLSVHAEGDLGAPPAPQEGINEGHEGTKQMRIHFRLSQPTSATVQADWKTADDTATAGEDYDARSGHLEFEPGETQITVTIPVHGDVKIEGHEDFLVPVSDIVNAERGQPGSGFVKIVNDDVPVGLSIIHMGHPDLPTGGLFEGDAGSNDARVYFRLDRPSPVPVSLDWQTVDQNATAGEDYVAGAGHITIDAGETLAAVNVPIRGDTDLESNEAFVVVARNVTNATLLNTSGYVGIVNDDHRPRSSDVGSRVDERPRGLPWPFGVSPRGLTAGRRLRLALSCPALSASLDPAQPKGCTGRMRVKLGSFVAGRAVFSLKAGTNEVIKIQLSRRGRRLLARHRRLPLSVRSVLRTSDGASFVATKRVTIAGLNPQPLPPGPDRVKPGEAVSLNPQPLPPRSRG